MQRYFLVFFLLFIASCQNKPTQLPSESQKTDFRLSIMQGATDANSAQINILAPIHKNYRISLHFANSLLETPPLQKYTYKDSQWQVLNFTAKGLTPDLDYVLRVYEEEELVDERTFQSLPLHMQKNLKVAVVSCLNDHYLELQRTQWPLIWSYKPDLLFLIGDNVYVDNKVLLKLADITDRNIWDRYVDTRNQLSLYKMKTLIPVFATWDDHDYGRNNADRSFPYKTESQSIFNAFFPMQENEVLKQGPGNSHVLKLLKQNFVFMYDRTFRSGPEEKEQSHFGKEQEDWLAGLIKKNNGPFWLISGDQFFGGYHTFDSYEGSHPLAFKKFLNLLKSYQKLYVFVSGDRHIAEVMRIEKREVGHPTYELTSSGLHTTMFPGSLLKTPNKRAIFNKDGVPHFLLLDIHAPNKKSLSFRGTFIDDLNKILFEKNFEVKR